MSLNCAEEHICKTVPCHRTTLNKVLKCVLILDFLGFLSGNTEMLLGLVLHVLITQIRLKSHKNARAVCWPESNQFIAPQSVSIL